MSSTDGETSGEPSAPASRISKKERIRKLEETVQDLEGAWNELTTASALLQSRMEENGQVAQDLEELREDVRATLGTFRDEMQEMSTTFRDEIKELSNQVRVLFRSVGNEDQGFGRGRGLMTTKRKIPEPHAYGGARDAKELENFLFDMDQYFRMANPETEEEKVATATMYLSGDAKL